jgi:hypothetical protein
MSVSDEQHDLVEQLATAAADAVRARRIAIEPHGAGALRSIVIEIEVSNRGAVLDIDSYSNWRQVVRGKGA